MKHKWIIIIGIVLLALVLGAAYLHYKKLLEIKWQWLSVLLAALIAPMKYLLSLFKPPQDRIDEIRKQHQEIRDEEHKYQEQLESRIKEREAKEDLLRKQVDLLNMKVTVLEEKSKKVDEVVDNMTVDEKKEKFKELFGE